MKEKSRSDRWKEVLSAIEEQICEVRSRFDNLTDLKDEYEEWQMNLPENLQYSPLGQKLEDVVSHVGFDSIETALDEVDNAIMELRDVELPKGFGRD